MQGKGQEKLKSYQNINYAFEKPANAIVLSPVAFQDCVGGLWLSPLYTRGATTGSSFFYCDSFVLTALHKKEKMFLSSVNKL